MWILLAFCFVTAQLAAYAGITYIKVNIIIFVIGFLAYLLWNYCIYRLVGRKV